MKVLHTFGAVIISAFIFLSCSTNNDPEYTLTTSTEPAAAGIITPSNGGFQKGSEVEITATANENMVFSGWRGDFMGSQNPTMLTMNSNKTIIAFFVDREYPLSIQIEGEGTVTQRVLQEKSTNFAHGTFVELTAIPTEGWKLVEWRGDLSGSENPGVIRMDKAREVTAVFERREYPLSISIEGEGSVSEQVIQEKSTDYEHGSRVQLTAHAADGWVFSGWDGDLEGNENPQTILIEQETGVTAIFKPVAEIVALRVQGEGTVDIKQIDSDTNPSKNWVQLTARPYDGWKFTEWQGDVTGSDNPVEIILSKEIVVNAIFDLRQYPLTIQTEGEGNVTEQVVQQRTTDYIQGTIVELTANPAQGWEFIEWRGDLSGSENPKQITVDGPKEVTAVFAEIPEIITYNLAINTQGQGSVNISPNQNEYQPGTIVRLTASPSSGWEFVGWTGDISSTQSSVEFTMDSHKNITAVFEEEVTTEEPVETTHTLSINIQGEGSVNINPQQDEYEHGTIVELTATPSEGWVFEGWTGDMSSTQSSIELIIDSNKEVNAVFKIREYPLTILTEGQGNVTEKVVQQRTTDYEQGTVVELTANAAQGWEFIEWKGDLSGSENPKQITVDVQKEVTAVFAEQEVTTEESEETAYTLAITIQGEGSVNINPEQDEYEPGTSVELTASASSGWEFVEWTGDMSSTQSSIELIIDSNKEVTAIFAEEPEVITYSLSITTQGEGSVNINPQQTEYQPGTSVELTASASSGWEFVEWTGDMSSTQTSIELIIDSNKEVTAVFAEEEEVIVGAEIFFAANGITVRCPDAVPGETGILGGVEYEVVDRNLLIARRDGGADLTRLCTTPVTDMASIFASAPSFNQNIGGWDTGNVTNMQRMFDNAHTFNQNIGNWNTGNVTNMQSMFLNANLFNQDIGAWDTGNVIDMSGMFRETGTFNQGIGNWNTRNVMDMSGMFQDTGAFNQDIEKWDTRNVMNMSDMFNLAHSFNQDIGNWNTRNVTNMQNMFYGASSFNQDIENWNTRNVTNMQSMFYTASSFNGDIEDWDTRNVTNMSAMFSHATSFNGDIEDWDTRNVTNMSNMFAHATSFNQDIEDWNTGNVTTMAGMFTGAISFNQGLKDWDTGKVTGMDNMFRDATDFNRDLSGWCVSLIPDKPANFDLNAANWALPQPEWGTCPSD